MQLVGETVSMYDPMKDKQIRIPEVIEKWGVPPEKMIDLQALTGDLIDNVPGVPGIGPKTAALLLEQFGDLDTLLARAGEIKQEKRRQSIIDNTENARISRDLVRLKNDVPLTEGLDDLGLQPPNGPKLIAFLKAMEFTTLTRRVAEATGADASAVEAAEVTVERGAAAHGPDVGAGITSPLEVPAQRVEGVANRPRTSAVTPPGPPATLPSRGRGPPPPISPRSAPAPPRRPRSTRPVMAASATSRRSPPGSPKPRPAVLFPSELKPRRPIRCWPRSPASRWRLTAAAPPTFRLAHRAAQDDLLGGGFVADQIPLDQAIQALRPLLADRSVLKIGHNMKFDWLVARRYGIAIEPFDDTMLLSYVADGGTQGGHDLASLSDKWLGHQPIPFKDLVGSGRKLVSFDFVDIERATTYATEGADLALRLWRVLKPRVTAGASHPFMSGWSGRCCPFWRAWKSEVSSSTGRCLAGFPANSRSAPQRWKRTSIPLPAIALPSVHPSNSATFSSAAWACLAARRQSPANGQPRRRNWKSWRRRATNCRAASSIGGS